MRTAPTVEDRDEVEELRAEPWMLDLLALNPGYVFWGPHEDYMWRPGDNEPADPDRGPFDPPRKSYGWEARALLKRWADMWALDELNECVNFYFSISRESRKCEACDESGLNPATKQISDDFYAFDKPRGAGWANKITQDEVQALVDAGRLMDFTHTFDVENRWQRRTDGYVPTAAEVNAWQAGKGLGHDAINRWILIETRAKRLGVYGKCATCGGNGRIYTSDRATVQLTLWMLHPRKGCSRGVEVQQIERDELPQVFAWLKEAAARNATRFASIPA